MSNGDSLDRVNPGEVITSDFLNQLLDKIDDLEVRIADLEALDGAGVPQVATGLAESGEFLLSNVPGASKADEGRATSFITHGLGAVAATVIVGLEDFGELPAAPDFERMVDRYYAFRDTGLTGSAFHVVAEVTKPYDGTFKLFTNVGSLQFFDRIRWWAIALSS